MKTTKFFIFALSSIMLMGCAKEMNAPEEQLPPVDQNLVPMTFKATAEDNATRTEINLSTGAVSWAVDDQIKLVWEVDKVMNDATSEALEAGDIEGGSANFKVSGVPATFSEPTYSGTSRHLYVLYPSDLVYTYNDNLTFYLTVPTEQDGSFEHASIALAKWNDPEKVSGASIDDPLEFKNLCGLLQIVIADDNVRKIVLHSDSYIAGVMNIGFPSGDTPLRVKNVVSGSNSITVNVPSAGTYYVAVVPTNETLGTGLDNVYVELFNGSDELIGDRLANNAIPVARKQVRKLGTIATGFSDRLYFTPAGVGTKDGSSWDDAGDVELLKTTMASDVTKSLYLAAGDYNLGNASIKCTKASKIKMYGGFPANPSGYALSDRNVSSNTTTIKADDTIRPFYIQNDNASWVFDGLSFLCTNYASANGGAFTLLAGTAKVNNCTFDSCSNTRTNSGSGGVIRVDGGEAVFSNCTFSNNTVTLNGGVFLVKGSNVTVSDCTFSNNTAGGVGGAVYVDAGGAMTVRGCTFSNNSATSTSGAIYIGGTLNLEGCTFTSNTSVHGGAINNAGTLVADGCVLSGNTAQKHGGAIVSSAGSIKLNDCSFVDNASVGASGVTSDRQASDLYLGGSTALYMNRCYLGQTTNSATPALDSPHRVLAGNSTQVGINNCVISGPFGKSNSVVQLGGNSVVVNTTVYAQAGGGCIIVGSTNADGFRSINNIVLNGSANMVSFKANDGRYMELYNTIYSVTTIDATGAFSYTSCVENKTYSNFPDNSQWAQKYLGTAATLPNGLAIKAYDWDGVCGGFTANSLAGIKTLISGTTSVGADFLSWLESDDLKVNGVEALAVDIRGNARNTEAMWPGSYEN